MNEDGEFEEVDEPYRVMVYCTESGAEHYLHTFTSETPKKSDDGQSPLGWRLQDNESPEVFIAGNENVIPKGAGREKQSEVGRYKFHCPVCKRTPIEVRAEKLWPILDTLARAGVPSISLNALAARI